MGSVGVLGTRMVYENAIAVVEAAADYLSELLAEIELVFLMAIEGDRIIRC